MLDTADNVELEAELRVPDDPRAGAVLAHPHPQYGGDMHSLVPSVLFDALPDAGIAALRFNFRGVGRSTGSYDGGQGEREDVVAALDALATAVPGVPLILAGWSFGGDVCLMVTDERIAAWLAIAAPLRTFPRDEIAAADDPRPKLLVVPERDQFNPPDAARTATADWRNTRIEVLGGADHMCVGRTDRIVELAVELVSSLAAR